MMKQQNLKELFMQSKESKPVYIINHTNIKSTINVISSYTLLFCYVDIKRQVQTKSDVCRVAGEN